VLQNAAGGHAVAQRLGIDVVDGKGDRREKSCGERHRDARDEKFPHPFPP
jgi:hypothetical protein